MMFSWRPSKTIQSFLALNMQSLFKLYLSLGFVELALDLIYEISVQFRENAERPLDVKHILSCADFSHLKVK